VRLYADTCLLLVSEMVTNALVHAGGPSALELRRIADGVRLSVTDGRSDQPEPRSGDVDELGGRGLLLVEALPHSWGVEPAGAREDGVGAGDDLAGSVGGAAVGDPLTEHERRAAESSIRAGLGRGHYLQSARLMGARSGRWRAGSRS
jgi:hypothetical protein